MAKWIIDSDHSCAAFAIRHMMIAHVRGHFNRMKGTIEIDPAKKSNSSVEVEIDVSSVTTGTRKRDPAPWHPPAPAGGGKRSLARHRTC